MNLSPLRPLRLMLVLLVVATSAWAGDLSKNYFGATKPGAWAEYLLTSPDGSKSTFAYQRNADADGHPVIELGVKILAGPGKDTTSKTGYVLPHDFNFERDGLNYGRFTEKMTMEYGGNVMPVDAKTLEMIKQQTKDFKGALTFEATEKIDGHSCDRYAYGMKIPGPNPTQETGRLWMDPSVPFGIVRQTARVTDPAGKLVTEFDMRLTDTGLNQAIAALAPSTPIPAKKPPEPAQMGLADAFKAGRVGMDLEVVPGSGGRQLRLVLVSKTDSNLTVDVPAGDMQFEVDSPVNTLTIAAAKASHIADRRRRKGRTPLSSSSTDSRGIAEGHCSLSVYEGTPLFSGSVTIGNLPK